MQTGRRLSHLRYARNDADFESGGTRCAGWLYTPEGTARPPVVVMAHGFAGERTFGLEAYAEAFVARGYAVFLFDYRGFGDSGGEPRGLVDPARQVADWEAAVDHVHRLDGVDSGQLALWGVSLSGGHVVEVAAGNHRVDAVVAQVPFLDGRAVTRAAGVRHALKGTVAGFRDVVRKYTFRAPYRVPVVADPDEFAVMNSPGAKRGMLDLVPDPPTWDNAVPARTLLDMPRYRPVTSADEVPCPVLLVAGREDEVVPASSVESAADEFADATLLSLPMDHFDGFEAAFDEVAAYEATFLDEHLPG